MSYDSNIDELVMFGGVNVFAMTNETWVFDGTNWVQLTTTTAPLGRLGASLAYAPFVNEVVLFGGANGNMGF